MVTESESMPQFMCSHELSVVSIEIRHMAIVELNQIDIIVSGDVHSNIFFIGEVVSESQVRKRCKGIWADIHSTRSCP